MPPLCPPCAPPCAPPAQGLLGHLLPGTALNLRQTMLHYAIGHLMIFQHEAGMTRLRQLAGESRVSLSRIKMVAFDGTNYNLMGAGARQSRAAQDTFVPSVDLCGVPVEVQKVASLDPRTWSVVVS